MKQGTYLTTVKCSKCQEVLTIAKADGDKYGLTLELEICVKCSEETYETGMKDGEDIGYARAETDIANNSDGGCI